MRRSRTILVGIAVTAALAMGALFGGVLTEAGSAPAAVPAPLSRTIADQALAGIGGSGTAAAVGRLEQAITVEPRDPDALAALGLAYQLRWRETGDASFLPRAGQALARALDARPATPRRCSGWARSLSPGTSSVAPCAWAGGRHVLLRRLPSPSAWSGMRSSSSAAIRRRSARSSG